MKMTRLEKAAGALILPGMLLLCTTQLPAAIAGVALLGAGAVVLNFEEIRAHIKKKAARKPERHTKNYSTTSYQKAKEMSRCSK